jgi:threonine dehydrogenase-like Zn-dependent dehydrogenase
MRVAMFNGAGRPITIERVADPEPGPGDLVVRVGRCGLCGSDLSLTSGGEFDFPVGCKLGHEYSGEVVELGRDVTHVKTGDHVACVPSVGCGHCSACEAGVFIFCPTVRPNFGGFGEYATIPRRNAVLLPRSLGPAEGALVEPMACGLNALRQAGMRRGDRIMVLGAGTMALAITSWARVLGAGKILVVSRSMRRREVALAMGADAVLSFEDAQDRTADELGGPPDIVAECVGKPGMLEKAIAHVRVAGTVVSLGLCLQRETIVVAHCGFKGLKICFPFAYSLGEFIETADAFEAGRIRPEIMVSDVIALEDLPATIERMRAGSQSLKVLVDPSLELAYARH